MAADVSIRPMRHADVAAADLVSFDALHTSMPHVGETLDEGEVLARADAPPTRDDR